MTTRTLNFYGQGWGPTTAEITVTLAGQTVYQGPIPTIPEQPPTNHFEAKLLFSVTTLDVTDQGAFLMTVTPTVGNVVMSTILTNYVPVPNPVYSPEQWEIVTDPAKSQESYAIITSLANPPFSEAELAVLVDPNSTNQERDAILAAHGVEYMVSSESDGFYDLFWQGDCRTNVTINDVPQATPDPRPDGLAGDWVWVVYNNSLLSYTLNLDAGLE
jgi:hypothetical protein